jgi:hypothetical protein
MFKIIQCSKQSLKNKKDIAQVSCKEILSNKPRPERVFVDKAGDGQKSIFGSDLGGCS